MIIFKKKIHFESRTKKKKNKVTKKICLFQKETRTDSRKKKKISKKQRVFEERIPFFLSIPSFFWIREKQRKEKQKNGTHFFGKEKEKRREK